MRGLGASARVLPCHGASRPVFSQRLSAAAHLLREIFLDGEEKGSSVVACAARR